MTPSLDSGANIMPTQIQSLGTKYQVLERQLILLYCGTCYLLFGKTISVMAGEAEAQEKWYGYSCCIFINWLLRDPKHCVNELNDFKTLIKHKRFLLGLAA